jgi:hypothetical protein
VYPSIGIVPGEKTALAKPFGNIHFAGESCHEIIGTKLSLRN